MKINRTLPDKVLKVFFAAMANLATIFAIGVMVGRRAHSKLRLLSLRKRVSNFIFGVVNTKARNATAYIFTFSLEVVECDSVTEV